MHYRLGVDIGGTFTDVILVGEDASLHQVKVLSTPESFGAAVLEGLRAVLDRASAEPSTVATVMHATTVATNAILAQQGAVTALVTTHGFRDVLEMGRMRHPSLSDIYWEKPRPLVPRSLRLELEERINALGEVEHPLERASIEALPEVLRERGVESLAVSFLHSYLNPAHERLVVETLDELMPELYVSASADILPEIREFERTSTAVVNAYLQPTVEGYVVDLERELADLGVDCRLLIMQSNGGLLASSIARSLPVQLVESGPAAGVIAAKHLATRIDTRNVIAFDMGGTTAKASLIEDGEPFVAPEYEVGGGMNSHRSLTKGGGYTIRMPSIDIAEVGAGGGSICWIDAGGAPRVGPTSAGAQPGPACYGRGGTEPTLTDAIVVLGYLNPASLAGGAQTIDATLAEEAIRRKVAEPLGLDLLAAAHGIYRIAIANMSEAVRAVSSERGRDPRRFTLVAFGGAGPAHAVDIAREFGITTVVVPISPGLFSTVGLLVADVQHHDVESYTERDRWDAERINAAFAGMEERTREQMLGGELRDDGVGVERFADLRYVGQSSELRVAVQGGWLDVPALDELRQRFDAEHERTYGHRGSDEKVEVVNLRLRATLRDRPGERSKPFDAAGPPADGTLPAPTTRPAYFGAGTEETPVLTRWRLEVTPVPGPMIVEDEDATTVVPPGASARRDSVGNIVIEVEG